MSGKKSKQDESTIEFSGRDGKPSGPIPMSKFEEAAARFKERAEVEAGPMLGPFAASLGDVTLKGEGVEMGTKCALVLHHDDEKAFLEAAYAAKKAGRCVFVYVPKDPQMSIEDIAGEAQ